MVIFTLKVLSIRRHFRRIPLSEIYVIAHFQCDHGKPFKLNFSCPVWTTLIQYLELSVNQIHTFLVLYSVCFQLLQTSQLSTMTEAWGRLFEVASAKIR